MGRTKKLTFRNTPCTAHRGTYSGGGLRIYITEDDTNSTLFTASLNMEDRRLKDNQIIIKNYGDNVGILEALRKAGIVGETIRTASVGLEEADIVELLWAK